METMTTATKRHRLLIVDDTHEILIAFERLLRGVERLDVRTVDNFDAALSLTMTWVPDLVLSDIDLGEDERSGFDLAMAVYPLAPVALMSGHVDGERRALAARVGAVEILQKPFSVTDEVTRLLGRELERAA